ncbi:MAG: LamG-like jellyroll fold domain-containing protein, partial [Planctomycetota bacterium]
GTLMGGPNWVAGQSGNALEFTGSQTYVDCGNAEALNVNVFSVSFWCNFPSTQGWNHIVSRGSHRGGGTPGAVNWGVMMVSGEAIILFEAFNDTGWNGLRANSTAGQWHHVVATYDGDTMQLYHDGVLAAETSGAGMLLDESRPLLIGARSHDSAASFFNGSVDEVGYFSVVLSPEDIQAIMDSGLAGIGGGQPLARRPEPKDGALFEQTWGSLSWSAGDWAVSHDVYIGENFDDVKDGAADTFTGNQAATTLIVGFPGFPFPDGLVPGTTYYWRIDEVNDANAASPWKGDVWSFSIPSKTAYNPVPGDGAKFIETDGVTLNWTPGFDARLHYAYFGTSFDEVDSATGALPQTSATFAAPGSLEPETTYYWRVDEFDVAETHKGPVWSFTTAGLGGGVKAEYFQGMIPGGTPALTRTDPQIDFNWGDPGGPDPAVGDDQFSARWTGEVEAAFSETYTFYTNSDDGVRLWIGGQQLVSNWTNHGPTENKGTIDLVAGNTYSLQMEYYEDGGGAVAELRWSSANTPKQVIPQAALSLPIKAGTPNPGHGATGASLSPILTWNAGDLAKSHDVYFGTDADAVANASKASPQFKATKALGAESYDPGKLAWETTYYWRVDEVDSANPDSPWVGNVWSFTTADFLVVDDFESYNDIDPPDTASNRVFDKWIDGFGTTTNGALSGNDLPPYTEQTIVHGGAQAMNYRYDNAGKISEATLTLAWPRDWTAEGVTKLSLWFNGDSANAADRMFIALNGSAVVYHDDASATQITGWNEWVIDLQAFADQGVALTNVNTITIGIGTKNAPAPGGGTGTMYFDDIRLIR